MDISCQISVFPADNVRASAGKKTAWSTDMTMRKMSTDLTVGRMRELSVNRPDCEEDEGNVVQQTCQGGGCGNCLLKDRIVRKMR